MPGSVAETDVGLWIGVLFLALAGVALMLRHDQGDIFGLELYQFAALTTGPPGPVADPWLAPRSGREGWTYAEFVHPHDVSRRIHEGKLPFTATRYGLLGYDLERGVVLRARLRGLWLPKASAFDDAQRQLDEFLGAPLPLST